MWNSLRKCISIIVFFVLTANASAESVYLADGFKLGEVTDHSVIVWGRITRVKQANMAGAKFPEIRGEAGGSLPEGLTLDAMEGAVPGAPGAFRVSLTSSSDTQKDSAWVTVTAEHDFTGQLVIDDLKPATKYVVRIEARNDQGKITDTRFGRFRTAPLAYVPARILCTSTSCQNWRHRDDPERGFKVYDSMRRLRPDFFVHTGDYVYYDGPGPTSVNAKLARHKWNRTNSLPSLREFYAQTPCYLIKDDHDTLKDDVYSPSDTFGELTFQEGLRIWRDEVPLASKPYRTFRWGKDLQIWIIEGREFRSPNPMPDGPQKSILGTKQKEWLIRTLSGSDATFKILFSPTPIVGPDLDHKADNHANKAFATEGKWLRRFLADQKNTFVINGDRHWQYVSVDPETQLWEFSQGPASDKHAKSWKQEDKRPQHRFLRVKGGFVAAEIYREDNRPMIRFTHYNVQGQPVHTETFKAVR